MNSPTRLVGLRSAAGVIAATALAVGVLALVRGSGSDSRPPTPSTTAAPVVTTAVVPSTTTPRRAPVHTVSVPNVVGLARVAALAALQDAGFAARVDTLPLPSVPAGFVVSQSPLPAAEIRKGATVALVVSAAP
jgi:hypothetical protein